jgi:Flp pilus assembly protein TadG
MLMRKIRRFFRQEYGVAATEFALLLPILITVLMGCFEASRYILLRQKLDRASSSVADLVSQATGGITSAMLTDIFIAAEAQTEPFNLEDRGRVIVTSVYRAAADEDPIIEWQCQGGGTYTAVSRVGSVKGGEADMSTIDMGAGWNVIVSEVYYDYQPFLFRGIFDPQVFYHRSFTRPRGATLLGDPNCAT